VSALTLVRRARVADLVGVHLRREASGVLVRDGLLLVVSDNTGRVAILDPDLALCGPHREIPLRVDGVAATRTSPPIPRPGGCLCWSKRCRHVTGAGLKPSSRPSEPTINSNRGGVSTTSQTSGGAPPPGSGSP